MLSSAYNGLKIDNALVGVGEWWRVIWKVWTRGNGRLATLQRAFLMVREEQLLPHRIKHRRIRTPISSPCRHAFVQAKYLTGSMLLSVSILATPGKWGVRNGSPLPLWVSRSLMLFALVLSVCSQQIIESRWHPGEIHLPHQPDMPVRSVFRPNDAGGVISIATTAVSARQLSTSS